MRTDEELREWYRAGWLEEADKLHKFAEQGMSPREFAMVHAQALRDYPPWSDDVWRLIERLERGDYDSDVAGMMGLM
jgi:hypothetical protein